MTRSFHLFLSDVERYRLKPRSRIVVILLSQGLWASGIQRFFHPLLGHPNPALRKAMAAAKTLAEKFVQIVAGISLPAECDIGEGLHIGHFGNIIISPRTKIGCNCNIAHGVTIGAGHRKLETGQLVDGVPVLGDRVYVGPGAVLLGEIRIGNDVAIGANAVVTKSLPDRAVVVGVPSRIISFKGSFLYVNYKGMEGDPARLESLQASAPELQEQLV